MANELYEVLGIAPGASPDDIKQAYREQSKTAHPDHGGDAEAFRKIKLAYDVLRDDERRTHYDATGEYRDEVATNDPDSVALGIIAEALMGVVQGPGDPVETDLVVHLTRAFDKRLAELRKELTPVEQGLKRTQALKGRFKNRKRKSNQVSGLIDWQIRTLTEAIAAKKVPIAQMERAREILQDYDFRQDAPSLRVRLAGVPAGTFASTSTFG